MSIQGITYSYLATRLSTDGSGRKVYLLTQVSGIGAGTVIELSQWAQRSDLWKGESNGCMMSCTLMIDPETKKMVDVSHRVNMGEMKSRPNPSYPGGMIFWYSKPTLDGVEI